MHSRIFIISLLIKLPLFVCAQHAVQYDQMGRMISNEMEEIASIEWNNFNQIIRVTRVSTSNAPDVEFRYDGFGNRVMKIVKPRNQATVSPQTDWHYTYYTYDARQQQLAAYQASYELTANNTYKQYFSKQQQHTYLPDTSAFDRSVVTEEIFTSTITFTSSAGPDVIGSEPRELQGSLVQDKGDIYPRRGDKSYGLKGEQQNIKAVVTDRKFATVSAEVLAATDYFPFGMDHPGRQYTQQASGRAYMSKEKMPESYYTDHYDFGARMYSASLGRWLSPDAHAATYPGLSPYNAFGNSPLMLADPDGNDIVYAHLRDQSYGDYSLVKYLVDENDVFKQATQKYSQSSNLMTIQLGDGMVWDGVMTPNNTIKFLIYIPRVSKGTPSPQYQFIIRRFSEIGKVTSILRSALIASVIANGAYDAPTNHHHSIVANGLKEYVKEGKHAYTDHEIEVLSWAFYEKQPGFQTYLQREADKNKVTKEHAYAVYTNEVNDLLYDSETTVHLDGRQETVMSPYFRGY